MAAFRRNLAQHKYRLDRLAYLVAEHHMRLADAAASLGISQQYASKLMKELELKVFGFNERLRRRRK